jgi:prepilin-type processing-associated H-X9-DG protein
VIVFGSSEELSKSGFGTLMYRDGSVLYQGDWKEDSFEGQGYLFNFALQQHEAGTCDPSDFSNLAQIWVKYLGDFEGGVMNGRGQISFVDGSVFQG